MKKFFSYLLLLTVFAFFLVACEKENENNSNQLTGTTWTEKSKYDDEMTVLEFSGNNTVTFFRSDDNLNVRGSLSAGTYTLIDNNITFNLIIDFHFYKQIFKTGTITGNIMNAKYDIVWTSGERVEIKEIYRKR